MTYILKYYSGFCIANEPRREVVVEALAVCSPAEK